MTVIEDAAAKPTSQIEPAKADLDTYGYCIHHDPLTRPETQASLERQDDQARLKRETGVASLGNELRAGRSSHSVAPVENHSNAEPDAFAAEAGKRADHDQRGGRHTWPR